MSETRSSSLEVNLSACDGYVALRVMGTNLF